MTLSHEHAALAVSYELQPGTWAFTLEDKAGAQVLYEEFAAEGPFEDGVIAMVVDTYLTPNGLVVDSAESWSDHDGRWSAIVDRA
jgi:hypothetical protein